MSNDEYVFEEEVEESDTLVEHEPWIVLIVDDAPEVHSLTKLALKKFSYDQKKLLFLSAYSAKEATVILKQRDDIAVILLDVIMETDTAGLDLVKTIRGDFQNNRIRIIICTGQPGTYSELSVVEHYDINDYKEKTELTKDKLYVTLRNSLSQYKQILELETSKESLKNQHMLLQKIIDLAPVGMFWKDKDGVYLGANKAFVNDAQLDDVSQMIGKTDFDMTWKKSAQQFRDDDAAVVNSGRPRLLYEEEQPKEDGSSISLVTSKVPLRDMYDNIIGVLGVYNDITELKKLQKEAKEKDEQLFKQSRMAQMGEMISMIAHQWRQPLSAISATVVGIQTKIELNKLCLEDEAKTHILNKMSELNSYVKNLSVTIDDFRNFYKPNKKNRHYKA